MTCEEYARLSVSDDPGEQASAARHAAACAGCAAHAAGLAALAAAAEAWREAAPPPRPELRERLAASLRAAAATVTPGGPTPPLPFPPVKGTPAHRRSVTVAALVAASLAGAALLLLPLAAGGPPGPTRADRLLVAQALAEAAAARRDHARAIARLERAAAPRLARAADPATPAGEAAPLLAVRNRLASLDAAIAEIAAHLDSNPANRRAQTLLLAAYIEKSEVLQSLLTSPEKPS